MTRKDAAPKALAGARGRGDAETPPHAVAPTRSSLAQAGDIERAVDRVGLVRKLLAHVVEEWAAGTVGEREQIAAAIAELLGQWPRRSLTERVLEELAAEVDL